MLPQIEGGMFGFQRLIVERVGSDPLVVKIWTRDYEGRVPPRQSVSFRPPWIGTCLGVIFYGCLYWSWVVNTGTLFNTLIYVVSFTIDFA